MTGKEIYTKRPNILHIRQHVPLQLTCTNFGLYISLIVEIKTQAHTGSYDTDSDKNADKCTEV